MNVLKMEPAECRKARQYLDSYVSGELTVETTHSVSAHIEGCAECRHEFETAILLRRRMREAVRAEMPPPGLEAAIRGRISPGRRERSFAWNWMPVGAFAAAAAMALIGVLTWALPAREIAKLRAGLEGSSNEWQESYLRKTSTGLGNLLKKAFGDHVHCTLARKFPDGYPKPSELKPHQVLEPAWTGFPDLVKKLVPASYEMVQAHRCGYGDRRFVHLSFRHQVQGEVRRISLIVLRKADGEALSAEKLVPAVRAAVGPLYQHAADNYQVAAFEVPAYVAYLISDLDHAENLRLARTLSVPVADFLNKIPS